MNEQILFDRLRYRDKLMGAGISEEHARAHVDAMDAALRENVATKTATKIDITQIEAKIDLAVRDINFKLGGMIVAGIAVLVAIKLFG